MAMSIESSWEVGPLPLLSAGGINRELDSKSCPGNY